MTKDYYGEYKRENEEFLKRKKMLFEESSKQKIKNELLKPHQDYF